MTAILDPITLQKPAPTTTTDPAQQEDLWQRMFERHKSRLFRLAVARTGNADDAEDVVQEVFLAAFRHLDELRHDGAEHMWLRRITINRCNDLRRHRQRRPAQSLDAIGEEQDTAPAALVVATSNREPAEVLDEQVARQRLRETIASLSDRLRPVATLRFLHDHRLDEIGRALGLSLGTVKSRLHRARTAVLEADRMLELADDYEPPRPTNRAS